MIVRIVSPVYTCECNSALMFLDRMDSIERRRMTCGTPTCAHFQRIVLEPVFEALPWRLPNGELRVDRKPDPETNAVPDRISDLFARQAKAAEAKRAADCGQCESCGRPY